MVRPYDGDFHDDILEDAMTTPDNATTPLTEIVRELLTYLDNAEDYIDTGEVLDYANRMRAVLPDEDAGSDPLPVNVYTNAPHAYDYETTVLRTVQVTGRLRSERTNQPFRLIALDSREDGYYAEYQQNRYKSGGYLVMSPEQWDQWVANGDIIIPSAADEPMS